MNILLDVTGPGVRIIVFPKCCGSRPEQRLFGTERRIEVIGSRSWHFFSDLLLPEGPVLGDLVFSRNLWLMEADGGVLRLIMEHSRLSRISCKV